MPPSAVRSDGAPGYAGAVAKRHAGHRAGTQPEQESSPAPARTRVAPLLGAERGRERPHDGAGARADGNGRAVRAIEWGGNLRDHGGPQSRERSAQRRQRVGTPGLVAGQHRGAEPDQPAGDAPTHDDARVALS